MKVLLSLRKDKKYLFLEITGKVDAFYLISVGEKKHIENFWGTALTPVYTDREDSPWNGATGGFNFLVNAKYFQNFMKNIMIYH